jgi:hypothetical protein
MTKKCGVGVTEYSTEDGTPYFAASIGPRALGTYWSKKEAANAYNTAAQKLFHNPIINNFGTKDETDSNESEHPEDGPT